MEMNIQRLEEIWKEIEIRARQQYSQVDLDEPLLPPAGKDEIDALEKILRVALPGVYRQSLQIHEGTIPAVWLWDAISLLDLDYVLLDWKSNVEASSHSNNLDAKLIPHGGVRDCMFDSRWIPVASDNGIPICLDLAPAEGGKIGQVIYVDWEDNSVKVIADDFLEFLEDGLSKMEA